MEDARNMTKLVTLAVVLLLGAAMVMSYMHGKSKRGGRNVTQGAAKSSSAVKAEGRALDRLHMELMSNQRKARLLSAKALVMKGDDASIPFLINAMAQDSAGVKKMNAGAGSGMNTIRFWCNEALKRISGRDFGFEWDGEGSARDMAILRWRTWYVAKAKAENAMARLTPSKAPPAHGVAPQR